MKACPQLRFLEASGLLLEARGQYVEARGAERLQAETALRIAGEVELLALREVLDQIEEQEEE